MNDKDRDLIALFVSNVMLNGFGFGPSMNTCREFVDQVAAEAAMVGHTHLARVLGYEPDTSVLG